MFIKVEYGSSSNISVQGVDYLEVSPEDFDADGNISESVLGDVWQEAVNEYMGDTAVSVVENEGD